MARELSEAMEPIIQQAVETIKKLGTDLTKDKEKLIFYVKSFQPAVPLEGKVTLSIGWKYENEGKLYGSYIVIDREEVKL